MECIDSPQTMQSICENIRYYIAKDKILKEEDIVKSCYLRADFLTYQELYARLLAGPSSRGQKRAKYYLEDGSEVDRINERLEIEKLSELSEFCGKYESWKAEALRYAADNDAMT